MLRTFQGRSQRQPRGTAGRIEVKSRCFDACLVIDGSLSFNFNDGTKAIIEILDEDALRDGKWPRVQSVLVFRIAPSFMLYTSVSLF